MTLDDVLRELMETVTEAAGAPVSVGWRTIQKWPKGSLDALKSSGLLRTTNQAETMECWKCENHCCLDVFPITYKGKLPRYFMVCDDSEMQGRVGRIKVSVEQLQQWRITILQLAKLVAKLWGFENKVEQQRNNNYIRIGMVDSNQGRKWLSLNQSLLELEVNGRTIPLIDALFFKDEQLMIDQSAIEAMAGMPPQLDVPVQNKKKPQSDSISHPLNVFRSMDDLKFREIKIRIDPDGYVLRISARKKNAAASFRVISLLKKNDVEMNRQGEVFMAIADKSIALHEQGVERAIIRLSASLRKAFDTSDAPFDNLKPLFKLSIPKTTRAKQKAEKRTVSYDDNRSTDAGDKYLEAFDQQYDPDDPTYSQQ